MIKVVGMGPFPLPGEKKRWARAEAKARAQLAYARGQKPAVPDTGRDGRHRHPEIRGILYGLLLSAPFWALVAWAVFGRG
jgi:hypothetical protein